jgi:rare lipoprotein A
VLALARRLALLALIALFAACPSSKTTKKPPPDQGKPGVQTGYATWYGGAHHGGPTASGEKYNKRAMTAAHRTLRMNTRVKVTNKRNGRSVILRINDRGPYGNKSRIIDVSEAAAEQLGMIVAGVVPVVVEIVP